MSLSQANPWRVDWLVRSENESLETVWLNGMAKLDCARFNVGLEWEKNAFTYASLSFIAPCCLVRAEEMFDPNWMVCIECDKAYPTRNGACHMSFNTEGQHYEYPGDELATVERWLEGAGTDPLAAALLAHELDSLLSILLDFNAHPDLASVPLVSAPDQDTYFIAEALRLNLL